MAGLAVIALLVGGIGIMNIMLVTVTERFREIGIRKALGARDADVLVQFLVESVLLAVLGGAVGMLLASVATGIMSRLANFPGGRTGGSARWPPAQGNGARPPALQGPSPLQHCPHRCGRERRTVAVLSQRDLGVDTGLGKR